MTAAICLLYSLLISVAVDQTENYLIGNYIEREHTRISQLYTSQSLAEKTKVDNNLDVWLTKFNQTITEGMQVYASDSTKLPTLFKNLEQGMHEFFEQDFYVLVKPIAFNEKDIVLIYDETTISSVDRFFPLLSGVLTLISLIIILISLITAWLVSKKIAFPISNLSQQLKTDSPRTPFKEEQRQDEIGELARTFSQMLARLNGFLEREKQFTRHTSHELRTPISVIANSLNVLKLPTINEEKKQRNLDRIERSARQINELIETFLLLGREESKLRHSQVLQMETMIMASLNKIEPMHISPELEIDKTVMVAANPTLVAILLDNLIKNAVGHAHNQIKICLQQHQLVIHNDTKSVNGGQKEGYGFGQQIIRRIVDDLGWRIEVENKPKTFTVTVIFTHQV